jgi:uncharacterized protein affecting Mg2+/Co2+ transport
VVTDRNVQLDAKVDQTEFDAHKADNTAHSDLVLNNEVENGDFSDGTTGWTGLGSALTTSLNTLTITGNGSQPYTIARQVVGNRDGSKYFVYSKMRITNTNSPSLKFSIGGNAISTIIASQNIWYEFYGRTTVANDGIVCNADIRADYADATTANGKVMEVDGNTGVFVINMTALGIEDYTEAEMLKIVQTVGYFEGEYNMTRKEAFDVTMALMRENRDAIIALGGSI